MNSSAIPSTHEASSAHRGHARCVAPCVTHCRGGSRQSYRRVCAASGHVRIPHRTGLHRPRADLCGHVTDRTGPRHLRSSRWRIDDPRWQGLPRGHRWHTATRGWQPYFPVCPGCSLRAGCQRPGCPRNHMRAVAARGRRSRRNHRWCGGGARARDVH